MFGYLISLNVVLIFLIALLITFLFDKRHPFLCYWIWSLFLVKLLVPWGFHEISFFNPFSGVEIMLTHPSFDPTAPPYSERESAHFSSLPIHKEKSSSLWSQERVPPLQPRMVVNQNSSYRSIYLHKFILLWVLISFLVAIREIHSAVKLFNILRKGSLRENGVLYDLFQSCSHSLSLPLVPKLVLSQRLVIPFSFGLSRWQYVVIPKFYESKASDELQIIFCHELAHLKKHDTLINLLRTLCLILFHIHPFRLVADFLLYRYQEITSDLQALKTLRISHEKYLNVLIKEFVFVRDRSLLLSLSSSLSLNNISFFHRLRYIKGYTPLPSTVSATISGMTLVFALFIASSNVSFSGSDSTESNLLITAVDNQRSFPSPIWESTVFATEPESYPILTNEHLIVVDPYRGFTVYKLQESAPPTPLVAYSLPQDNQGVGNERIRDVRLYRDTIYVAIGNANGFSFEFSRIEVLQWTETGEIIEIGVVEQNHPRMLQIVGDQLWVAGSGEDIYEGAIWIYDLHNPGAPEPVQMIYVPYFPSVLVYNSEKQMVYAIAYNTVYIFQSGTGLSEPMLIQPPYLPIRLVVLADNTLVIHGIVKDLMESSESYLLLYKAQGASDYLLTEIYHFTYPPNTIPRSPVDLLGWDQNLLVTFSPMGVAQFRKIDQRLEMVQYEEKDILIGDLNRDYTVFLFPQTTLYRTNDFHTPLSLITSWGDYEFTINQPQG